MNMLCAKYVPNASWPVFDNGGQSLVNVALYVNAKRNVNALLHLQNICHARDGRVPHKVDVWPRCRARIWPNFLMGGFGCFFLKLRQIAF